MKEKLETCHRRDTLHRFAMVLDYQHMAEQRL